MRCALLLCSFFVPISPDRAKTGGDPMGEDGGGDDFAVPRDAGGRYVPGSSGNPAGKPRGCLNRATRLAAALLEGKAKVQDVVGLYVDPPEHALVLQSHDRSAAR